MKDRIAKALLPASIYTLVRNAYTLGFKYGQYRSARSNASVDAAGHPIPWYTYPAIEFIRQLDFSKKRVFEYGSGNSTLFWSKLCTTIVSVEDDIGWYEMVRDRLPSNADYHLKPEKAEYLHTIRKYSSPFDVIIIDGKYRLDCAREAVARISENAMIILDNSDWHEKTSKFLQDANLIQVDMSGFTPINYFTSTTSFFFTREFRFGPAKERQPMHGIGSLPIRREAENT